MKTVSVIIPCRNESANVTDCIESILKQDYPHSQMEVLIVDGMSTDGTREILNNYSVKYDFIKIIDNQKLIVPTALNIGIQKSTSEIIIRLDMHTIYAPNYISTLVNNLLKLNADNVGCVCKTDVKELTPKSLAIKNVLSSRFGVGNSSFRVGIDKVQKADTVPFGCYPRQIFERFGLFNERLVRNQDIEFNSRITNSGGSIYLLPDELCTYYARATFSALAKNSYSNGLWNVLTVKITHSLSTLSLRHFVPMLFVLSIILPLIAAPFFWPLALISVGSAFAYLIFITIASLQLKNNHKLLKIRHLLMSFIVLHISYGVGSFIGIFTIPKR